MPGNSARGDFVGKLFGSRSVCTSISSWHAYPLRYYEIPVFVTCGSSDVSVLAWGRFYNVDNTETKSAEFDGQRSVIAYPLHRTSPVQQGNQAVLLILRIQWASLPPQARNSALRPAGPCYDTTHLSSVSTSCLSQRKNIVFSANSVPTSKHSNYRSEMVTPSLACWTIVKSASGRKGWIF